MMKNDSKECIYIQTVVKRTKITYKSFRDIHLFSVQHPFWSCETATLLISVSINKLECQFETNTLIEE